MASLTVERQDNGKATFTYTNGTFTKTASGFWDDATPWQSGSYNFNFAIKSNSGKDSFLLQKVLSRSGIMIHHGTSQYWSEGCLIVDQSFIDAVYNNLEAEKVNTAPGKSVPFSVSVTGDFDVKLKLSSVATKVSEGDSISLKIELTGKGADNGLSKDIYVKLAVSGGNATEGSDYDKLTSAAKTKINDSLGWVKLSKGQTSTTVNIPTTIDNDDSGTESPSETASFKIVDYKIANIGKGGKVNLYHDGANILTAGSDIEESVQIINKPSIIDSTVNASGGNEGYQETAQFAPGQTLKIFFEPYTIPDRMLLTSDGKVILDTSFVGGHSVSTTAVIPKNGTGMVDIQILTNDPGTAWTFTISNMKMSNAASVLGATLLATGSIGIHEQAIPITKSQQNPISISQDNTESLEGDDWTIGSNFTVILNDTQLRGKSIEWIFIPTGNSPATVNDFSKNAVLNGVFTVAQNAIAGQEVFFNELPMPIQDNISEGKETFKIEFRDAITHQPILDKNNQPITANFSIADEFTITTSLDGTDGDDNLTGTNDSDVIHGGLGNDTIDAKDGNDFIFGGVGDDKLFGGNGDDEITPDFGQDTVNGGSGFDKVFINRKQADITVIHNGDGTITLSDTSGVPLGNKILTSIEQIVFSDKTLNLNQAPIITSNNGKDDARISVVENSSKATQITATDSDAGSTLTYSISGGVDASLFVMDGKTGILSFKTLPDFEKPADANKNNEYEVSVQVSDGSLTDAQNLKINVTNVANESAPVITANGGKDDATISVVENNSKATQITATDSDAGSTLTYSISGGADASLFVMDGKTGILSFKTLPDFEKSADANKNNEYEVSVQVSDGSLTDTQNLKINVTDMTNEFNGTNNQDVLFGTANADFMNGYGGNDLINGWAGNDTIFAGDGNDLVYAGTGNDVIYAGAGNDVLKGDSGADTFYFSTGFGHDSILDFNSEDKVGIVSSGINNFADLTTHMSQSGADTIIKLNSADELVLKNIGIATLTSTEFFFV